MSMIVKDEEGRILLLCKGADRNIVSTINLDCKLDLKTIALEAHNADVFADVIMRIWEPKTTTIIFVSGKMVFSFSSPTVIEVHVYFGF
ncbi:hypothetical protein Lal_00043037 [Lupinus albus]|nr:hypothetical protein Lal_00043037 [Lupinus albus]